MLRFCSLRASTHLNVNMKNISIHIQKRCFCRDTLINFCFHRCTKDCAQGTALLWWCSSIAEAFTICARDEGTGARAHITYVKLKQIALFILRVVVRDIASLLHVSAIGSRARAVHICKKDENHRDLFVRGAIEHTSICTRGLLAHTTLLAIFYETIARALTILCARTQQKSNRNFFLLPIHNTCIVKRNIYVMYVIYICARVVQ